MSQIYDNWEILVGTVLRKEELRQLALCASMNSCSISSSSSSLDHSFNSSSQIEEFYNYEDNLERSLSQLSQGSYLDPINEKSSYLLGARELAISWADDSRYWRWISQADSRFPDVAELEYVWWLDIRGKIRMSLLSPDTIYAAYLVYKLAEKSKGLESANAIIKFPDVDLERDAERRALVVHLQQVEDRKGKVPVSRDDGWMEVELGKFYAERDDGEVEAGLVETKSYKTGLIVRGIEFRPTVIETPFVLRKRVARRNWRIKTKNSTSTPISNLGGLRVSVGRGIDLADGDQNIIRPYVVLKMGNQKLRTRISSTHSNPEWHQDLTFLVPDTGFLVSLTVRSYNKFLTDSKIGNAEFDVKPMIEASAMDMEQLPNGTIITTVRPSTSNCLAEESCVIWENGKLVQDLHLKLKNVKSGAVMIQLQWIHVPGWRAH